MARIHDMITLEPGRPYPSLGTLMGTSVSTDVFASINDLGYKSFFGSEIDDRRNDFMNRHILPMDAVGREITQTVNALMNPDRFRILESIEDFQAIPPCMELPIALFAPIRQGIIEGRFSGFGFDPDNLPTEDMYGRLIDNFRCDDVLEAMDDEGNFPLNATYHSDDPELSDDDLTAIERTRAYILNKILPHTDRDPTEIDLPRG